MCCSSLGVNVKLQAEKQKLALISNPGTSQEVPDSASPRGCQPLFLFSGQENGSFSYLPVPRPDCAWH